MYFIRKRMILPLPVRQTRHRWFMLMTIYINNPLLKHHLIDWETILLSHCRFGSLSVRQWYCSWDWGKYWLYETIGDSTVDDPLSNSRTSYEKVSNEEAEAAARAYYENTAFEVISLEVKSQTEKEIVFSAYVSKGGMIREPDRTITLRLNNGVWEVVNEGYWVITRSGSGGALNCCDDAYFNGNRI